MDLYKKIKAKIFNSGIFLKSGAGPIMLFAVLLPLFFYPAYSVKEVYEGRFIKEIQFIGLKNTDSSDLLPLITMEKGKKLVRSSLNDDVKALYDTGFFSNVILSIQMHPDKQVTIYFELKELPRVEDIELLGVEELFPTDLEKLLTFSEDEVFSLQKVKDGKIAIKKEYMEQGLFLAEVWYRISKLDVETNTVKVTYIIDEGEEIPISKINIIGTKELDPEAIREELEQVEEGFVEEGAFRESTFEDDKYKILAYAKSRGFLDVEIDPALSGYEIRWRNPSRPEDGRVVIITYKVIEGEIRYFGGYSLEHNYRYINRELNPPERKIKDVSDYRPIYKPRILLKYLEYNESNLGDIFDEGRYFRDRGQLQEMYSRHGYVFAQVQPIFINVPLRQDVLNKYEKCLDVENPKTEIERKCKNEAQWINLKLLKDHLRNQPEEKGRVIRHVHFIVRENGQAYIENIIIKGMVKTQEHVIRRELLIKEGQLFNSLLVKRSRERIANLGYFKEVNLKSTPGSDETKMNLVIHVVEQPTGTISMGGGYGTESGFSIFTELGENNLNGTGQRISGRLEFGPLRKQIRLSWREPWVYEYCRSSTGKFWKNKIKDFDEARNLATLEQIADSLQNNYRRYGKMVSKYINEAGEDSSIETLDRIKIKIRKLLYGFVTAEEECHRTIPRPWALNLSAFWLSTTIIRAPTVFGSLGNLTFVEDSLYEVSRFGVVVGISHRFLVNWIHFHSYSPSWTKSMRPSPLVSDSILKDVELGLQFKSSIRQGLIYDTRDSIFNPNSGLRAELSVEIVGQMLQGQDHYNRYNVGVTRYWWWFDYTFGGLFRKSSLRRWRVVQEFRLSGTFTHETAPYSGSIYGRKTTLLDKLNPFREPVQDREIDPFIEPLDRLFIGGVETVRGYDYYRDAVFPDPWMRFVGGSHRILGGTELRIPIEPTILWFVLFLDGGALYLNLGELTEDGREYVAEYENNIRAVKATSKPIDLYISENFLPLSTYAFPFGTRSEWNNPKRTVFSQRNIALDRAIYSWGFGIRVQIPVLPLRLYMAKKIYYAGGGRFKTIPGQEKFQFVFSIGDFRF